MTYKITFGSGHVWPTVRIVETEEWQNEQDALDIQNDQLESEGCEGCFLSRNDYGGAQW